MSTERSAEATSDPDSPPQFLSPRALSAVKAAVVVMSVLLVLGFALVMILISRELASPGARQNKGAAAPDEQAADDGAPVYRETDLPAAWWRDAHLVTKLNLPVGSQVQQMTLAGDRIALLIDAPGGRQIILFDLITLREIGVIRLTEGEPAIDAGETDEGDPPAPSEPATADDQALQ